MTEVQLSKEIGEIQNDKSLTNEEKKLYLSIYGAELEKVKYDNMIKMKKQELEELRLKAIDRLVSIIPNLSTEQFEEFISDNTGANNEKEYAYQLLQQFRLPEGYNDDGFMYEGELVSSSISGSYVTYLDDEYKDIVHKMNGTYKSINGLVERKYLHLEEKLDGILDSEVFEHYIEDEEVLKDNSEFDSIFIKNKEKIDKLDIGTIEKGMLRRILLDSIKYGVSRQRITGDINLESDDLNEYIDQKENELKSGKSFN